MDAEKFFLYKREPALGDQKSSKVNILYAHLCLTTGDI